MRIKNINCLKATRPTSPMPRQWVLMSSASKNMSPWSSAGGTWSWAASPRSALAEKTPSRFSPSRSKRL